MKAIILHEAGGAENLRLAEIDKPVVKDDEVLVKTTSISINPVDLKARAYDGVLNWLFGDERPVILGWDISGEAVEVGKGVTDFKVGDQVFGMVNFFGRGKAYAEYAVSPSGHLARKPQNVTHQQAAASALAASTAYQALTEVAKIKKGDRILIHGASGGVGHFAVQIAKHFGAYVIGTSSAKNKDFVLSSGAREHFDYAKGDFSERLENIDIVLDTVAGETLNQSIKTVRANGIIVTLPSPEIPQESKDKAAQKQVNLEFMMVSSKSETIRAIALLLESQSLVPHIHKTFSFEEMGKAHAEAELKQTVGKIIVNV